MYAGEIGLERFGMARWGCRTRLLDVSSSFAIHCAKGESSANGITAWRRPWSNSPTGDDPYCDICFSLSPKHGSLASF